MSTKKEEKLLAVGVARRLMDFMDRIDRAVKQQDEEAVRELAIDASAVLPRPHPLERAFGWLEETTYEDEQWDDSACCPRCGEPCPECEEETWTVSIDWWDIKSAASAARQAVEKALEKAERALYRPRGGAA